MGLLKKIKKAVSKVVKAPLKAVGLAADVPDMAAPEVATPATQVEAPKEAEKDLDSDVGTESGRKKARAGGKKSLSVARSSGGGINL